MTAGLAFLSPTYVPKFTLPFSVSKLIEVCADKFIFLSANPKISPPGEETSPNPLALRDTLSAFRDINLEFHLNSWITSDLEKHFLKVDVRY